MPTNEATNLYDGACNIVARKLAEHAEILHRIPPTVVIDIYQKVNLNDLIDPEFNIVNDIVKAFVSSI